MPQISKINYQGIRDMLNGMVFTKAGLAINAASAPTVKTTGAVVYSVAGIMLSKAALSAQSIAPTHDCYGNPVAKGLAAYVQPANTTVYYALALDAVGNVLVSQGSYAGQVQKWPELHKVTQGTGDVPAEPSSVDATPFGLLRVTTGATTFTPGTTNLDAANVTTAYIDLSLLPSGKP